MVYGKLNSRTLPRIPLNLHHSRLFMRKAHFAFFVEAVFSQIADDSVPQLASSQQTQMI